MLREHEYTCMHPRPQLSCLATALNIFVNYLLFILGGNGRFKLTDRLNDGGRTFCRKTFCRGHFADGHFVKQIFCRTEILTNGLFAEKTFCRTANLPKQRYSLNLKLIVDFDDRNFDSDHVFVLYLATAENNMIHEC
jgi:hypothetical protein